MRIPGTLGDCLPCRPSEIRLAQGAISDSQIASGALHALTLSRPATVLFSDSSFHRPTRDSRSGLESPGSN